MLFVLEELTGQEPAVVTAVEQASKAPHNIIVGIGNPDHQLDPLHTFCTVPGTLHVRASALDHPNIVRNDPAIVPGAVSRVALAEDLARYTATGPLYLSRVRGLSPQESTDALIKLSWCYAARDAVRPSGWEGAKRAMGVDVANSENGDPAAVARGRGAVCEAVEAFPCPNANLLGDRLAIEALAPETEVDGGRIGVDVVGVGVGTYNQLTAAGLAAVALNSGGAMVSFLAPLFGPREKFNNLRSQMHWLAREDIRLVRVYLPDDPELFVELIAATWGPDKGRVVVESKETIRPRLRRSPNKADAFIYWNWVRQVPQLRSAGQLPWYPGMDQARAAKAAALTEAMSRGRRTA